MLMKLSADRHTMCFKDCGLHFQKYWYNKCFACFVGKLDSSHVEIYKKNKPWSLKYSLSCVKTDVTTRSFSLSLLHRERERETDSHAHSHSLSLFYTHTHTTHTCARTLSLSLSQLMIVSSAGSNIHTHIFMQKSMFWPTKWFILPFTVSPNKLAL